MKEITLTFNTLEKAIREVFTDFDELWVQIVGEAKNLHDAINNRAQSIYPGITISGKKGEFYFLPIYFSLIEYDAHFKAGIAYHLLENEKGSIIRMMENMSLQK